MLPSQNVGRCTSEYTLWATQALEPEYYEEHYYRANNETEAFIDLYLAAEPKK